jgi:hypothetical protein
MSKSSKNFSLTLMQPRFFKKVVAVGGVDQEMFGVPSRATVSGMSAPAGPIDQTLRSVPLSRSA